MPVTFITGRMGAGKTEFIVERLRERLEGGSPLLFVVPEQATLLTEWTLMTRLGLTAAMNLEVLSPSRLLKRVLDTAEGAARVWIDERGRRAALRRAVLAMGDDLRALGGAARREGFVEELRQALGECARNGMGAQALRAAAKLTAGASRDKLLDMADIWDNYRASLEGHYADDEDALPLFEAAAPMSPLLSGATLFVDAFDAPSARLLGMLPAAAAACKDMFVTFRIPGAGERDADMFAPVVSAYARLSNELRERGIETQTVALAPPVPESAAACLGGELFAYPCHPWHGAVDNVRLLVCENPAAEAAAAADGMYRALMSGTMAGEIAVICADTGVYGGLLRRELDARGIPSFMDAPRPALSHPAMAFLSCALDCATRNYPQKTFLKMISTGYAGLSRDQADALAACAVNQGLTGWRLARPVEDAECEAARARVMDGLSALEAALERARDGSAVVRAVWAYLEESGAAARLAEEAAAPDAYGMFSAQVQDALIALMEQLDDLLGEEATDGDPSFMLQSIREGLNEGISVIPPMRDAVRITQAPHLRAVGLKRLYVLGLNDGLIPAARESGLLGDAERGALSAVSSLFEDKAGRMCLERLTLIAAMSLPEQSISISYALKGDTGEPLRPSPYLKRIARVLPGLKPESPAEAVTAPASTLPSLAKALRRYADGRPIQDRWLAAAGWFRRADAWRDSYERAEAALFRASDRGRLSPSTARALYSAQSTSASQLEAFAECPLRHFVGWGLRPSRIEKPEIGAPDAGIFQHASAEHFLKSLPEGAMGTLTPEEIDRRAMEAAEQAAEALKPQSTRGGRAKARVRELGLTARRAARVIAYQLSAGAFEAVNVEAAFGGNSSIALDVPGLGLVRVKGRIDRVDAWQAPDGRYIRVIDYKTSRARFSLSGAYYGLKLQLLIYLDAAAHLMDAKPAGMFLFHIDNRPLENLPVGADAQEAAAEAAKALRLDGLALKDMDVLHAMEEELDETSDVLAGIRIKKNGELYANSPALPPEEFDALLRYARTLAAKLVAALLTGEAAPAPVKEKDTLACAYCSLNGVCPYDNKLEPPVYREIGMTGAEALKLMIEEGDAHA